MLSAYFLVIPPRINFIYPCLGRKKILVSITDIFRNTEAMLNVNYSTVAFFG
jgi:hypothetical protein